MLVQNSKLMTLPILSVQDSGPIGSVATTIVDPDSLKIIAFRTYGAVSSEGGNILDARSVREYSKLGLVIDSADELILDTDVVKIKKVLELNFDLLGLKVEAKSSILPSLMTISPSSNSLSNAPLSRVF